MKDALTFHIGTFSGPLDFLIALVQNQELSIEDIPLMEIIDQFLDSLKQGVDIDAGAEFVGSSSLLIWLKSKLLLPRHEQPLSPEEEQDPRFEIIHHLLDYCRFREAAKSLSEREQKQYSHYYRGVDNQAAVKKPLGIEHLSLDDFASLFKKVAAKTSSHRGIIQGEQWKVSDKIKALRTALSSSPGIAFEDLFNHALPREELIVIFLAVLEMMKGNEVCVVKIAETGKVVITAREAHGTRN